MKKRRKKHEEKRKKHKHKTWTRQTGGEVGGGGGGSGGGGEERRERGCYYFPKLTLKLYCFFELCFSSFFFWREQTQTPHKLPVWEGEVTTPSLRELSTEKASFLNSNFGVRHRNLFFVSFHFISLFVFIFLTNSFHLLFFFSCCSLLFNSFHFRNEKSKEQVLLFFFLGLFRLSSWSVLFFRFLDQKKRIHIRVEPQHHPTEKGNGGKQHHREREEPLHMHAAPHSGTT